jgi:hypothetical protein
MGSLGRGNSMTARNLFLATCLAVLTLSAPASAGEGGCDRAPDQTATPLPVKDDGTAISGGRSGGAISGGKTAAPSDDKLDHTLLFDIDKFAGHTRCGSDGCDRAPK